jgi:hypothetical protein
MQFSGRRVQYGAQPDEASNPLTRRPATHNRPLIRAHNFTQLHRQRIGGGLNEANPLAAVVSNATLDKITPAIDNAFGKREI